jgi:choline-sulfatase
MVTHFDGLVGRRLDAIGNSSLSGNTVTIYCSDHDEMADEHGAYWKSNFYEGAMRVPLVVSGGGLLPEGRASSAVVNLTDHGAPPICDSLVCRPTTR